MCSDIATRGIAIKFAESEAPTRKSQTLTHVTQVRSFICLPVLGKTSPQQRHLLEMSDLCHGVKIGELLWWPASGADDLCVNGTLKYCKYDIYCMNNI